MRFRSLFLPLAGLWTCALLAGTDAVAVEAASAQVDSLLEVAMQATMRDDHARAIEAYRAALAIAPRRLERISAPLAFQYAWSGRLGEARREFVRATALAPDDRDLRLGELLVTNWMGNHLEAWRGYEALHRLDVTDPAPLVGLAAAQNWAGRKDLALNSLATVRALNLINPDAARLETDIRSGLRPVAGSYYDFSEDSDEYRMNGLWAEVALSPHPQWRLVPFLNRVGIRRTGSPPIDEDWAGARFSARPWTRVGFQGRLVALLETDTGGDRPVVGDGSIGVTFSDAVQATLYGERFALVSYRTFPEKITGESLGASITVRPDWLTRVRASLDTGTYSDDNSRWNAWLVASRQVWAPARLRLGATGRWLDFDRWLDNGIWTPENFRAAAATMEFEAGPRTAWSLTGGLELGAAREGEGNSVLYAGYWAGFHRALGPWILEGRVGHSEGNVETGNGYDRSYAHLGLRAAF